MYCMPELKKKIKNKYRIAPPDKRGVDFCQIRSQKSVIVTCCFCIALIKQNVSLNSFANVNGYSNFCH